MISSSSLMISIGVGVLILSLTVLILMADVSAALVVMDESFVLLLIALMYD